MKTIEIKGVKRTGLGKKETKKLRKDENVPCVLYGGKENVLFYALKTEFKGLIYTPNAYTVNLDVDGEKYQAILKDAQFHPMSEEILHVDFYQVSDEKKVVIEIPVQLNGFSVGVQAGGKLSTVKRKLKVKGFLKDLPDILDIDVTSLELGKTRKVLDLSFDNLELLDPKNTVVCAVKLTRAAKGAAGAAATAETGKKK